MDAKIFIIIALMFACGTGEKEESTEQLELETQPATRELTPRNSFTSGIEGPAVAADGILYAVNYGRQGTIGQINPDGMASEFIALPDSSIGNGIRFNSQGDMLIADYTRHNILKVNMSDRNISVLAHEPQMNQPNDLAITSTDILFASDPNWKESTGQLWRITPSGEVTLLETSMGTTNGLEVSPDDRILYVNESVQRKVWAYDLDSMGNISNKRMLIEFPDFGMDGMRCDSEGNLYITRHGKGTVVVVSPQGEILKEYKAAGKNITNIAFGGDDGKTCFITVADHGNLETFKADFAGRSWILKH